MKVWIAVLVIFGLAPLASAEIFRTVDEHGNVVFSDIPPPPDQTSEPVRVNPPNTFDLQVPATDSATLADPEVEAPEPYDNIAIVRPTADATVRENAGNVSIAVSLEPPLRAGHRLVLYMDGNPSSVGAVGNAFQLLSLDRGTHTVGVRVLDGNNAVLGESVPVTFHLQRVGRSPRPGPAG